MLSDSVSNSPTQSANSQPLGAADLPAHEQPFQFGLRGIFVFTAIIAALCGAFRIAPDLTVFVAMAVAPPVLARRLLAGRPPLPQVTREERIFLVLFFGWILSIPLGALAGAVFVWIAHVLRFRYDNDVDQSLIAGCGLGIWLAVGVWAQKMPARSRDVSGSETLELLGEPARGDRHDS